MKNKVIWDDVFHTPHEDILNIIRNPIDKFLPASAWGPFRDWHLVRDSIRDSVKVQIYIATCEWVRDSRNEYENS